MSAWQVRADYQCLGDAADRFGRQAQAARQTLRSLQRELDTLQAGDWVGQGATAFYGEMSSQVLPSLARLVSALASAQQTAVQISQIMAQAEANAARVLRGNGAPGMSGLHGLVGLAAGPVSTGVVGAAALAPAPAATPPFAESVDMLVTQNMAAVDNKLDRFSRGVQRLVKQSPTLSAQMYTLQQANYRITIGPPEAGFATDRDRRIIRIVQPLDDADTVAHLAHEAGHALTEPPLIPETPQMRREQFVLPNVHLMLLDEGAAQFNAAQVRAELRAAGGPDIGLPGHQTAAFQQAYDDCVSGHVSHDQAVARIATLMETEHASTPPYATYPDTYRDYFEKDWDINVDQPLPPRRRLP